MPTVSVIIPAYNGTTRYLSQAIRSVLNQTYQEWELIVVDDASMDRTDELVRRFPQARYHRLPSNRGQAAARNQGARLSTSRYLAFLDQDDLWEPTFLEETVPLLELHSDAAIVHCDGYQVSEHNDILEYDHAIKHGQTITQLLRGGHDVATSGSLFRTTSFKEAGGYDEALTIWEDIDLAIRLYQRHRFLHVPKPLYRHRLYGHNVSRDIPSERALDGRKRFLDKHTPHCRTREERRALKADWAHYYRDQGKHWLRLGRPSESRRAFWLALRFRPFDFKTYLRLLHAIFQQVGRHYLF